MPAPIDDGEPHNFRFDDLKQEVKDFIFSWEDRTQTDTLRQFPACTLGFVPLSELDTVLAHFRAHPDIWKPDVQVGQPVARAFSGRVKPIDAPPSTASEDITLLLNPLLRTLMPQGFIRPHTEVRIDDRDYC